MKAEKDSKTGKWLIQYRYTDWQGKRRKSMKRGFATKREAEEWARDFLSKRSPDFNMKFKNFVDLYFEDMETRLRASTVTRKHYLIDLKILPYFGEKPINEISVSDIRTWQNMMLKGDYSQTYLRTMNNEIKAIFENRQLAAVQLLRPDKSPWVTLCCEDFPILAVWANAAGPFVCLEPWRGRTDDEGFAGELAGKVCEQRLAPGETEQISYSIEFHR